MLSEFGKFPAFEENWKPTDLNKTKALIYIEETEFANNRIFYQNRIKHMLHFELHLSQDLITFHYLKDLRLIFMNLFS